jgi:hypothetical protein
VYQAPVFWQERLHPPARGVDNPHIGHVSESKSLIPESWEALQDETLRFKVNFRPGVTVNFEKQTVASSRAWRAAICAQINYLQTRN